MSVYCLVDDGQRIKTLQYLCMFYLFKALYCIVHIHNWVEIFGPASFSIMATGFCVQTIPFLSHTIHIFIGENGTIDGQGDAWWNKWRQGTLQFTRPNLVEFVNSRDIIISNVIFKNSPFWNIHPVYSRYRSI